MSKKLLLIAITLFTLTACNTSTPLTDAQPPKEKTPETQTENQQLKTYQNEDLGISFQYPSSFVDAWENKYKEKELLAVKFPEKDLEFVPAEYETLRTCDDYLANGFYEGDLRPSDCETLNVDGHNIAILTFDQVRFGIPSKSVHFETLKGVWKISTTDQNLYEKIVEIAKTLKFTK